MNAMTQHVLCSLSIAWSLLHAGAAVAQAPGSFDTSWRPNGRIVVGASGVDRFEPDVVAVIDGRVTVAGTCGNGAAYQGCAFRLDAAGNIDESYGDPNALNNVVRSSRAGLVASSAALTYMSAVDPEGRVIWMPQRINAPIPIGRLDPSGTAASIAPTTVDLLLGETDAQYPLRIKAVGEYVYVGGAVAPTGESFDAALARLDGDLRLDPAFNGSGVRRVGFDGVQATSDDLSDFVVSPDGRVHGVVVVRPNDGGERSFWVVCFNPDGSLDAGFGAGGRALVPTPDAATVHIAVDSLGRIVLGGFYNASAVDFDVYVLRLTSDGAVDTTFGFLGTSTFGIDPVSNADDVTFEVGVQPDDKPIIAGRTRNSVAMPLFVARLTTSGDLDADFGSGGLVVASFGGAISNDGTDTVRRMAFDPEGRLYMAGSNFNDTFAIERAGVARIVTGIAPDSVFADDFE